MKKKNPSKTSNNQKPIKSSFLKKRAKSFTYAYSGLKHTFINEDNFKIHIVFLGLVSILAYYLEFSTLEWIILILLAGFVLITEIINTLIEEVVDHLIKEHHEGAKIIKDVGAASVLLAATVSVIIGLLLFIPKLFTNQSFLDLIKYFL